jgi:hypothetical protein
MAFGSRKTGQALAQASVVFSTNIDFLLYVFIPHQWYFSYLKIKIIE